MRKPSLDRLSHNQHKLPGLAALILALVAPAPAVELTPLVRQIRDEVKPDQAMTLMRSVYSTDRWFTFPKFQETARYLERSMRELGLKNVELLGAPADGVTQFGYWTMPLAWDVKQARLELVGTGVPEEFRILADYARIPTSLGMWSGSTPPQGITAEVTELKDDSEASIERLDMKGKLVLTSVNPANIKWQLVRKGALGAINAFTENPDLPDGRQWINAWGNNGWAFLKNSTPLLCFSISPRQARFLRQQLAGPNPVRVKATVESRYYSGVYPYVTGVVPGTGSEEVLTLGHTSEQGAQDNATGVAAMLESLATLTRLIEAGKLPRPQRSIRILAMGELYGSTHYIATHPEVARRTVAAMCVDTPAAPYHLSGTEYTFHLNPHVAKSYVDAFIIRLAESYFGQLTPPRPWHWSEYSSGTDNYLGEPTVGIPTVWPYSGTGVVTHHNSEDVPDAVDPRSLRDLAVVNAAYLYFLASAGEREARWLAEIALSRGFEQITRTASAAVEQVLSTQETNRGELLADGLERIAYFIGRESQSVLSTGRLLGNNSSEFLPPLVRRLEDFGQQQMDRLKAAAGGIQPKARPDDQQIARAKTMVVRRKNFGTITLDQLPPDQREGYPPALWSGVPVTALYWCDGRRTLAEVIRLTRLELGPTEFDFVGYFRFLAKHGYVEIQ